MRASALMQGATQGIPHMEVSKSPTKDFVSVDTVHDTNDIQIMGVSSNVQKNTLNQPPNINTARELQVAFTNLQGPVSSLIATNSNRASKTLALLSMDNNELNLSDGTGTKERSNLGVPFTQSAPNSDGEHDDDLWEGVRTRKSIRQLAMGKRNTRQG